MTTAEVVRQSIRNIPHSKRQLLAALLHEQGIVPEIEIPCRADRSEAPLSIVQRRLWFLDQMEPGGTAYRVRGALTLNGALDVHALQQAISVVVARHETLRTIFPRVGDEPMQKILPPYIPDLPVSDLTRLTAERRSDEFKRLTDAESAQPFDLAYGPLLRTMLFRITSDQHALLIDMHHIISDGASRGIFLEDLAASYAALKTGHSPQLPELAIQYGDFAAWQREWLQGEVFEAQLAYWRKQLADSTPVLELPHDYARPKIQTYNGGRGFISLSPELSAAVRQLGRSHRATPFMTMLAAFQLLLSRLTGQDDIVVGTPMSGRTHVETERLIGFFINTLVLRARLHGNPAFSQLLASVRETCLEAYAHQDVPFEKLVEELHPERDLGRTPLFQVMFNMVDPPLPINADVAMGDVTIGGFFPMEYESQFDMTMFVTGGDAPITVELVYNADLFRKERIAEMLQQYHEILRQVTIDPNRNIDNISLVTNSSRAFLPDLQETIQSVWTSSIPSRISENALQWPNRVAINATREKCTYSSLETWSNRVANSLIALGVARHDVVAVHGDRSAALILALLAIWKAGAAFTFLDPSYPAPYLLNCLHAAKPRGLVALESCGEVPKSIATYFDEQSGGFQLHLAGLADMGASAQWLDISSQPPASSLTPDDLAYITFLSGSTGKPVGVRGTHGPLSHFLEGYVDSFGLKREDRFSMLSGLAQNATLRDIFAPLWVAATICIPPPQTRLSSFLFCPPRFHNPQASISSGLRRWMRASKITVANLTPTLGGILTDAVADAPQKETLPHLRYAFFSGEPLRHNLLSNMMQLAPGATCANLYNTTEAGQVVASHVIRESGEPCEEVPIGKSIDAVQLAILNRAGQLTGVGEIGELCVRTPYLTKGYVDNQALTKRKYIHNPFTEDASDRLLRTGDIARYRLDGSVDLAGRRDEQLKINGYRIEPCEIESALSQHPVVSQAAVCRFEKSGAVQLVAFIVTVAGARFDKAELRRHLVQRLPAFMLPTVFIQVGQIPLTPDGKIDRSALSAIAPSADDKNSFMGPRDDLEVQLARIWQAALNVDRVSIRDNFFDLGGHSLLAVRLFGELEKVFGKTIPVATIFQAPTIEVMARVLRQEGWEAPWSSLVALQPQGSQAPFFCVHSLGANLVSYGNLARTIGLDQPFYGLQPVGLDGKAQPHTRVEEMASHYVAEIRQLKPHGPYCLGGVCLGGVIAFEMAQQLLAAGEDVERLILIDAYFPGYPQFMQRRVVDYGLVERTDVYLGELILLPPLAKLKYILTRLRNIARRCGSAIRRLLPGAKDITQTAAIMSQVKKANSEAALYYKPGHYPGRIVMLWCSEVSTRCYRDLRMAWSEVCGGGLEVHVIPGNHMTMVEHPHVNILAATLRACLQGKDVPVELAGGDGDRVIDQH